MLDINSLPDISELESIETNFRVFAGPGAGKTTWLIEYLINILKTSCRLHRTRKIACITYTNVAAEEVMNKMSCDKCRFDISTIHKELANLSHNKVNKDALIKGVEKAIEKLKEKI